MAANGLSNGEGLSHSQGLNNQTTGLWSGNTGLVDPNFGPAEGALLQEDGFFLLQESGSYILLE
jgi:hypothetical protein